MRPYFLRGGPPGPYRQKMFLYQLLKIWWRNIITQQMTTYMYCYCIINLLYALYYFN